MLQQQEFKFVSFFINDILRIQTFNRASVAKWLKTMSRAIQLEYVLLISCPHVSARTGTGGLPKPVKAEQLPYDLKSVGVT